MPPKPHRYPTHPSIPAQTTHHPRASCNATISPLNFITFTKNSNPKRTMRTQRILIQHEPTVTNTHPRSSQHPHQHTRAYTTVQTLSFFALCKILTPKPQTPSIPTRSLISCTKQLLSHPLQPENNVSVLHNAINASSPADTTTRRQWCFIPYFSMSDGTTRILLPQYIITAPLVG
jgi:hypothetical protein